MPKRHAPDFGAIGDGELSELASLLARFFGKLRAVLNDPPFGVAFHTAPLRDPDGTLYHWHIEVRPRLALRLGFEWATGVFINTTPPEKAAAILREAREATPWFGGAFMVAALTGMPLAAQWGMGDPPWGWHMWWGAWGVGMMVAMVLCWGLVIAGIIVPARWVFG